MQKALIVTERSVADLNKALESDEFVVSKISANPNGSWLVILDDEAAFDPFGDVEFEEGEMYEEDDDDEDDKENA